MPFAYMGDPPAPPPSSASAAAQQDPALWLDREQQQDSSLPAPAPGIGADGQLMHALMGHEGGGDVFATDLGSFLPPLSAKLFDEYGAAPENGTLFLPGSSTAGASSGAAARPQSASASSGSGQLFHMPAFLLGGYGSGATLAPGGGAEVLRPVDALLPSAHAFDAPIDTWQAQATKKFFYSLDEQPAPSSRHDASFPAPAPRSPRGEQQQAASPFARYLQDAPSEKAPDADSSTPPVVPEDAPTPMNDDAQQHAPDDDNAALPTLDSLAAPEPSAGLPVYSQSGFDMLALLARVATRPDPLITLGPVDLTCAFLVADARADDAPIVYVSRTFCELTGYAETEVLGRNCRFLQAPGGQVRRGERRALTSPDAVRELRYAVAADREVQVSLVNYRKDGTPFVNRVSIIPVSIGDRAFHVGFQVDLNEQPNTIANRMRDGKFYSPSGSSYFPALSPAERSAKRIGPTLRRLLADRRFQASVSLSTSCHHVSGSATESAGPAAGPFSTSTTVTGTMRPDTRDAHQWLHFLLLERTPDLVHVLSLKGFFLYASPAAAHVLGYEQHELVGRSVAELCHPNDAVPLLRELKESSTLVPARADAPDASTTGDHELRGVDLLFRLRKQDGSYAWIECDGRLHTEPGKGRKAIVLLGRRRVATGLLRWGVITDAGGLLDAVPAPAPADGEADVSAEPSQGEDVESESSAPAPAEREREFWAVFSTDGLFLVASVGVRDVLGWGAGEVLGRSLRDFVDSAAAHDVFQALRENDGLGTPTTEGRLLRSEPRSRRYALRMCPRDGVDVRVELVLYTPEARAGDDEMRPGMQTIAQFKVLDGLVTQQQGQPQGPLRSYSDEIISPSTPFSAASACTPGPHSVNYQQQGKPGAFAPYDGHLFAGAQAQPGPLSPYTFIPSACDASPYTSTNAPHSYPLSLPPPLYVDIPQQSAPVSTARSGTGAGLPRRPARIGRPPRANVFAELESERLTSWQYELQQLKYANRRLREEIAGREERRRRAQGQPVDEQ